MQNDKINKEKIKKQLSMLKGKFTGDPFCFHNAAIKIEFMHFVVDYYENLLNDIREFVPIPPKN